MQGKEKRKRSYWYLASVLVLAAGLTAAGLIAWSAQKNGGNDTGYEIVGGFIYPGGGGADKRYEHDLQLYGGDAAVLADEFLRWFYGLWEGENLAYTVATLSLISSLVLFLIGRMTRPGGISEKTTIPRDEGKQ